MVSVSIRLLGPPRVLIDGVLRPPPRGKKVWALLAALVLLEVPPTRSRMVSMLFANADDPLGALRWTLAELRNLLGPTVDVGDDPLRIGSFADIDSDVEFVLGGEWSRAVDFCDGELLEGLEFPRLPEFELWLADQRRYLRSSAVAVLTEAALASLASGNPKRAVQYAASAVRLAPLDENAHTLWVQTLAASGSIAEARAQMARSAELLRNELGCEPGTALLDAVSGGSRPDHRVAAAVTSVEAQLEAAQAAFSVGAVTAGLDATRAAVNGARSLGNGPLLARALLALGSGLVHVAKGRDVEGATALHEAMAIADRVGDHETAAATRIELAWVEFLRSRYSRAEAYLVAASQLSRSSKASAWVNLIRGAAAGDRAEYAESQRLVERAIALSGEAGDVRTAALAQSFLGKQYLMRDQLDEARAALDASLRLGADAGWTAFLPWPEALLGEVEVRDGNLDTARDILEHAYALGVQVDDPCWQSIAARGLGLVAMKSGDTSLGRELLVEAPVMCRRLPDTYLWIEAFALDGLCAFAVDHDPAAAPRWIRELEALAASGGMRELVVRASGYRGRLGDHGAAVLATDMATDIDNPALSTWLEDLLSAGNTET